MKQLFPMAGLLAALAGLAHTSVGAAPTPTAAQVAQAAPDTSAVLKHHAVLVHAAYADTLSQARRLHATVDAFLRQPNATRLATARQAWLQAREFYGQTEAFRFYGGPIDGADGPEGRLNAWPMDEAYVDAVQGRPEAGLINRRSQTITKATLSELNERDGEENIATGWHAIEFMLWGQDRSGIGPGDRSPDDFVDGKAPNADRRRQYLRVVTDLLLDDLGTLVQAWAPDQPGNYRAAFERGAMESLRKVFVGLGSLSRGELAGERLEVALASQDQEDEHSCFSDNTHRDAVTNALGIQNVWLGQLRRADGSLLSGPGLRALVAARDAALAERTTQQIGASVAAAEAIPVPFDQAIVGGKDAPGRQRVQDTVNSLTQQSKDLATAAAAVGITQLSLSRP